MAALAINGFLGFLAGVLLNFTPCVLPVMPLKIQAVLKEIRGDRASRAFAAVALLLGSLSLFLPLGIAAAYFGILWGELFQSRAFLGFLSIILLVAALSTFFGWTFRLPQLVYRIPLHRYLGAFLTGALAGVLSTPCSGPFLGSVLAYTVTQPPAITLVIFAFIGAGLAFPYVLLVLFPGMLAGLPRGGRLAADLKELLGFILLGGSLFFAQVFLPAFAAKTLLVGLAALLIIWAASRLYRAASWAERSLPALVLVLLSGAVGLDAVRRDTLRWHEIRGGGLPELQAVLETGRPAIVEFTADWCLNCKVLERTVYENTDVRARIGSLGVTPVRFDMTEFTKAQKEVLTTYGGLALPHAVLLNANGEVQRTFSGMFSTETLLQAISEAVQSASANEKAWVPREGLQWLGRKAPDWKGITWLQGGPLTLDGLRGKVVLLRFWLTDCPYCVATAPALNEFLDRYQGRGLAVVGIHHPKSEGAKDPTTVRKAVRELRFKFPIGMDNSWSTVRAYGVGSDFRRFTSVSFVIDQAGLVQFVHDGGEYRRGSQAFEAIETKIEELLRASPHEKQ